ncbi:uncharacterized protein LOC131956294 [Physella acuta]|uniref:uncharacterized protein LOC131956294 n=1 Tax=Physella acuta TaxID=109671 RepID=UPI0027DBD3F0|nr:uncharacterized protein LOC131956294 [Physella acuta]
MKKIGGNFCFTWPDNSNIKPTVVTKQLKTIGLPCRVDAAIDRKDEILVFKGCSVWRFNASSQTFQPHGKTDNLGLPCNLDAAVEWRPGAIFIKGAQYWREENDVMTVRHTDELNICSWSLCGEADWMQETREGNLQCNGDSRLCSLTLNQVTLPGLHNAGAGFDGGFGFVDCWVRNHARSIYHQLTLGIRHLDIDPCYKTCGLVGTCHSIVCVGSICPILKQVRRFLRDHRDDVISINFNHEITEPEIVFKGLNKQLQRQLGPMLNSGFRDSGETTWPTLGESVRTNQRVFVFYAPIIESEAHRNSSNYNLTWIHSERLLGSTWKPFSIPNTCKEVVDVSRAMCRQRQNKELLEVSIVPESPGCNSNKAQKCQPYLHEALKACEESRHPNGNSPNVLLVDYPEENSDSINSVFHAVFHQNVRNIFKHRPQSCVVKIDAAVSVDDDTTLFFVGEKIIVHKVAQTDVKNVPGLYNIDTAYKIPGTNIIKVFKGCESWDVDGASLLPVTSDRQQIQTCDVDAAVVWNSKVHVFKGCSVTSEGLEQNPLPQWGLPCNIDTVLLAKGELIFFKGNEYWTYTADKEIKQRGNTLDWRIDAVKCQEN